MAQTATFTQDTYYRGQTMRADFTWSGATECQGQGPLRAWYYILFEPTGSQVAYGESTLGASSAYLTYTTGGSSPLGTYIARINIYTNYNNCIVASASDTCVLQEAQSHITVVGPSSKNYGTWNVGDCSGNETWTVYSDGMGAAPTTISLVGGNTGDFECTAGCGQWTGAPGSSRTVTVRFCPTTSGARSTTLRFYCLLCGQTIDIPLYGTGSQPQYPWHVNETSHDFGSIPVNECSEIYPITVYNDSDIQLDFASTCQSGSCDPFNPPRVFWSTGIASIPAHGSYNFGVQFCPLGTTTYSCVYRIVCLTPNGSPAYIDLSYTGAGTEAFTIGGIDINGSIFYAEFTSGQQNALITQIRLMNMGGADGLIYTKYFYQLPGGPWQQLTDRFEQTIAAGDSTLAFHYGNIPDVSGEVLFGVKVWGEDEVEPPTLSIIFSSTVFC